jgi:hypothetical protein
MGQGEPRSLWFEGATDRPTDRPRKTFVDRFKKKQTHFRGTKGDFGIVQNAG